MKALIIKKGNTRGRYYSGRSVNDIAHKFVQSKSRLHLIRLVEYSNRYELTVVDGKSPKRNRYGLFTTDWYTNRRIIYIIPKDKIIN